MDTAQRRIVKGNLSVVAPPQSARAKERGNGDDAGDDGADDEKKTDSHSEKEDKDEEGAVPQFASNPQTTSSFIRSAMFRIQSRRDKHCALMNENGNTRRFCAVFMV